MTILYTDFCKIPLGLHTPYDTPPVNGYNPNAIPLTNNHAERQIRHYVTYRKNSYFTQSERGDRFLERLISVYLTYKQTGHNPFLFLMDVMSQKSG